MTIKQAGIEFKPEFDIDWNGHSVATATCPDCGEVPARYGFAIRDTKYLNALDCPDCMKVIALEETEEYTDTDGQRVSRKVWRTV